MAVIPRRLVRCETVGPKGLKTLTRGMKPREIADFLLRRTDFPHPQRSLDEYLISFTVTSKSDFGVHYDVDWNRDTQQWDCTCPAGPNPVVCTHVWMVAHEVEENPRYHELDFTADSIDLPF